MTVTFSDGNSLLLPVEGLPARYEGYILSGGEAWHTETAFSHITLQQAETVEGGFRILHIDASQADRIGCRYLAEEKLLCIRAALDRPVTELIKGSGKQRYDEKQFSVLFGRQWQSLIDLPQPGRYIFFDMIYKEVLITGRARNHPEVKKGFLNTYDYIPERIMGKKLFLTLQMHRLLTEIRNYHYTTENQTTTREEKMGEYLARALAELDGYNQHTLRVSEKHWQSCQLAQAYIANHLDERFTIPELSRKAALSATGLKQAFPRIFDYTIDEYHRHLMLKRTFNKLADKNVLIKSVVEQAGYAGASAFAAAFKKTFLCMPSEFNSDQWDTKDL